MIFVGRNHIFAVANDGKAVVVGDDRVIGIDLERLAISLDREQGIHEPESFDLAGCRAPLAADQLLAEAGGMRMMIFELDDRSEEHTSELQSLMRNSYAVFCLKQKNRKLTTYIISKRT